MHIQPTKLETLTKYGLITLTAIMPFHAFLAIYFGHLFGHQALWQAWKEALILVMCLGTGWLIYLKQSLLRQFLNPINLAAVTYIISTLLVSLVVGTAGTTTFWFGFKTDLAFVVLFFIAQFVATRDLKLSLAKILIITSTIVSILALIQSKLLAPEFLTHLGYSASTISPVQLVDPAVKSVRAFATLGGPNQLGAFLILPICLLLSLIIKRFKWRYLVCLIIIIIALTATYSRSAWIGAFVAVALVLALSFGRRGLIIASTLIAAVLLSLVITIPRLSHTGKLQYYLLHSNAGQTSVKTSNPLHLEAIKNGLTAVKQHPLGQGLGTAGPASTHGSTSFITENYYLQIAVESGLLGLLAFLAFQFLVALNLFRLRQSIGVAIPLLAALVGISLVNMLLHGWADSTLAYVYWTLAGVVIGYKHHVESNQV